MFYPVYRLNSQIAELFVASQAKIIEQIIPWTVIVFAFQILVLYNINKYVIFNINLHKLLSSPK